MPSQGSQRLSARGAISTYWSLLELPLLAEEIGRYDLLGADIRDGPVRQHRDVARVAHRRLVGEREAAVEDAVFLRVRGIGVADPGGGRGGGVFRGARRDLRRGPLDRQLVRNL